MQEAGATERAVPGEGSSTESHRLPVKTRTLDLEQAAEFLQMSPAALREKARAGIVPGAKPGKRWVFIEQDLVAHLRRLCPAQRQAPLIGSQPALAEPSDAVESGGPCLQTPAGGEHAGPPKLPTGNSAERFWAILEPRRG